jgi:hypothetical protein
MDREIPMEKRLETVETVLHKVYVLLMWFVDWRLIL